MPTPPSLHELQAAFAAAIVEGEAPALAPWIATRGIDPAARLRIYRHANLAIHVEALATGFPAVQRLLGEEAFDGLATRHAAWHSSTSGNLQRYGDDFARFLAAQPETAAYPWLSEVARLEWLRQESALAAADRTADAGTLIDALSTITDPALRLQPHLRVCSSPAPVLDLWRLALGREPAVQPTARAQHVLLWRAGDQLSMCEVSAAQAAFTRALAAGQSLAAAWQAARLATPEAGPDVLLRPLLEHALISAVLPHPTEALPA